MKIIFEDNISVFQRPPIEKQFKDWEELKKLLKEYGDYKYAYTAVIYDDNNNAIIPLIISDTAGWTVG